jgi:hypothetical protein
MGQCAMSSERDSYAKGIFTTFAKGFLLHKLFQKVNYSPLRVKKSRSHDIGQYPRRDHKLLAGARMNNCQIDMAFKNNNV